MVKNLQYNLTIQGDSSLIPGQGTNIPHAVELLSPHTTTRESLCTTMKDLYDAMKIPCVLTKTRGRHIKKKKKKDKEWKCSPHCKFSLDISPRSIISLSPPPRCQLQVPPTFPKGCGAVLVIGPELSLKRSVSAGH